MYIQRFQVTSSHIKLLKNLYVSWGYDEFGAPCIDPKRPFGNSNVYKDMLDIFGIDYGESVDKFLETHPKHKERLDNLYKDLENCLQILLIDLSIQEGWYEQQNYSSRSWVYIGENADK